MKRVAVVGGGISGLAAAYYLGRRGIPCTLFEREPRTGGLVRTERAHGCLVEAGPESWLAEKRWMRSFVEELGLGGQVIGSNDHRRKTFVLRAGRLLPLPDSMRLLVPARPWQVVTTRLFGPATKARIAMEWFRSPVERPDRSAADFVRDHFGSEAVERLAQPMMAGVYGVQPEDLSARLAMPRLVEYERRYGSILRGTFLNRRRRSEGPLFLTLRDGMGSLVAALQHRIERHCRIVHSPVQWLGRKGTGWTVGLEEGAFEADALILAVPAHAAGGLLRRVDPRLAASLRSVSYTSSVVVALSYPREGFGHPLDGFGFLVPRAEGASVAACTWASTKFDGRSAPGRVLLRAFLTGKSAEQAIRRGNRAVAGSVEAEVRGWMGIRATLLGSRVYRWPKAMPAYGLGHESLLRSIDERLAALPGLLLAGNGYTGLGIPDCVRRSEGLAAAIGRAGAGRDRPVLTRTASGPR